MGKRQVAAWIAALGVVLTAWAGAAPALAAQDTAATMRAMNAMNSMAAQAAPDTASPQAAGDAGSFDFGAPTYVVPAGGTSIQISVGRSGGSTGAVSVKYATVNGTAKSGTDYTAASGTLNWASGDAAAKTFNISVNSNANPQEARTILLSLSAPGGGAALGNTFRATITLNATVAVGQLALSVSTYRIVQGSGNVTVSVYRTAGSKGAVGLKYTSANDTAVAARDYTAASGTLSWAAGDANPKTFTVAISGATPFVGTRSLNLYLAGATGGAKLGSPSSGSIIITGDGDPGTVSFSAATYSVAQNAGKLTVTVVRGGGADGPISTDYTTSKGNGVAGADYTPVSGTLRWATGDTAAKTFTVPISYYAPFSGSKTFALNLLRLTGGAKVATPYRSVATINGVTGPGTLAVASTTYAVAQTTSNLVVSVNRSGGANGAVAVNYATSDKTAHAGTEYTAASGTLNWASGDAFAKTFKVPISAATPFAGARSFTITLSGISGGATLGTAVSTATINGSGGAGTLAFSAATASVLQNAGNAVLTVTRSGNHGAVSINWATSDGTATSAGDYTGGSGTLNWADGDATAKTISVPLSNALPYLGSRNFNLSLSGPGGGAVLGVPNKTVVTVTGSIADHPSAADAVRFLEQTSFGPNDASIALLQQIGISAYLDQQFAAPLSGYDIVAPYSADSTSYCHSNVQVCVRDHYSAFPLQMRFFQNALRGGDQLRQRVAWALAQIMVISANKVNVTYGLADYHQLLSKDAFGTYRQLLEDVTLSPAMGNYLDMVNNDKEGNGATPNENYAREVMQLFSVGTVLLNSDGSQQLDSSGNPIPTYDQDVVEGLAHVFTGWTYPAPSGGTAVWGADPWYRGQMAPLSDHHDTGSKLVLGGQTLPAGQSQATDLQQALDSIANHPNVGTFIGRKLIQFLVTSNPTPAYVNRITAVFNNNGSGVRGDLKAVVKAILLDPEARGDVKTDLNYGKLREPVLFLAGFMRAMGGNTVSDGQFLAAYSGSSLSQDVFDPATVFNFYPPDYPLPGTTLVAPVLSIYNTNTGILRANLLDFLLQPPRSVPADATVTNSQGTALDLSDWLAVAGTTQSLVDKLNRIFFHGAMSAGLSNVLTQTIDAIPTADTADRAQAALYLALTSAEYQVEQ